MKKDYETLLFEQDIIRVLRKHELISSRLTPSIITINIDGGMMPMISITSKLKTIEEEKQFVKEEETFYKEEDFEKELFDEGDKPDIEPPDFDFRNRL